MFKKKLHLKQPQQPRKNIPLTSEQVKALPVAKWHTEPARDKDGKVRMGVQVVTDFGGFTATGIFPNNAMRRNMFKIRRPNNRATTRGRVTVYERRFSHTENTKFGEVKLYHPNRFKKVRHNNPNIKNQAFSTFDK